MTVAARVIFALLVIVTFGAFFVAQRLKATPAVLQDVRGDRVFSPDGDGINERLRVSFLVKETDVVDVDVLDADDEIVAGLVEDRRLPRGDRLSVRWNGRDDGGARAADGIYRLQVTLREENRTVVMRRRFRLDTTPPVPVVEDIGPVDGPGPELLPNREGAVRIQTSPTGRESSVAIYRTSGERPELVTRVGIEDRVALWNGEADGRRVDAGTYVAVAQWRDRAGNLGSSVPMDREGDVPDVRFGSTFPGRGGITVRYLELQPPVAPVGAGNKITVGVDARGARYRWSLRRLGVAEPVREGSTTRSPFTVPAPQGAEGVYLFEARRGRFEASVPILVVNPSKNRVLVVLPLMTWQGRNAVDDDGDGVPNLLDLGMSARTGRNFAGGRLPEGFTEAEGPLLSFLARNERYFDVTTDVALATGRGPKLAGHRGVLLPGDVRWLPRELQVDLREFVKDGGTMLLTGTDSLRREVRLGEDGVMTDPTTAATTNLFGSRLRQVAVAPTSVTNLEDEIALFSGDVFGGTGVLEGFRGYEATAALGDDEELAAKAVNEEGDAVIVAARYGDGLVIRTGLLDFATRLNADPDAGQLLLRSWTLLSTG